MTKPKTQKQEKQEEPVAAATENRAVGPGETVLPDCGLVAGTAPRRPAFITLVPLDKDPLKHGRTITFTGEHGGQAALALGECVSADEIPPDVLEWIYRLSRKPARMRGWELLAED